MGKGALPTVMGGRGQIKLARRLLGVGVLTCVMCRYEDKCDKSSKEHHNAGKCHINEVPGGEGSYYKQNVFL